MFYWLAAIPFFIALMMLAVVKLPEHSELKRAEDMQTEVIPDEESKRGR